MGFAHLDRFADRPSWLAERTSPVQRLWLALAAAFAAGLMPPGAWRALAALAVVVALGVGAAGLPAGVLARRVAHALPFFLLPALALPFSLPGPAAFELGPLTASTTGLLRAAEVLARATLALTAVTTVVSITRAADLLSALETLPLPRVLISSLALAYRYVYVLNDELERTRRALASRAGDAPRGLLWRARAAGLGHLLVRAHARGTRVHAAMLSRGYSDRFPTLTPPASASPAWSFAIVVLLALLWLAGLLEATA